MTRETYVFADFTLDPGERLLLHSGRRIELAGRYFDALLLLVRERGTLVSKDRMLEEVWRGVPVTDEALTQCVRVLRLRLGDDASRPRFIETVPRHGYRFVAQVERGGSPPRNLAPTTGLLPVCLLRTMALAASAGGIAGLGGGLFYGLAVAAASKGQGTGVLSLLLVMLALNVSVGVLAGLGIGSGLAAARLLPGDRWQASVGGGMLGGLLVGGVAWLVGLDIFAVLFGHSLVGMTSAGEGALLGAALGMAVWVARARALGAGAAAGLGALAGGFAGMLAVLLGGHLFGGSLNLLAQSFPQARFRLDAIGTLLGEQGFGTLAEMATASLEGALLGLCLCGMLALARKQGPNGQAAARARPMAIESS